MQTGFRRLCLAFLLMAGGISAAASAERGTAEEAQALVARAIEAYKSDGPAVFERITAPSTEFRDRDLYVFVIGPDHKTVAHGGNARNVGYDLTISGVDYEGKRYGEEMVSQASEQGAWVDYKYPDPNTGQVLSKSTWFVLHDGYIFGSGIYKP